MLSDGRLAEMQAKQTIGNTHHTRGGDRHAFRGCDKVQHTYHTTSLVVAGTRSPRRVYNLSVATNPETPRTGTTVS